MKKFLIVMFAFLACASAFAYTNLEPAPEDIGAFFSWLVAQVDLVKAGSPQVIMGIVIAGIIGAMKLGSKYFAGFMDKLGNFGFFLPIVLGAVGELAINLPASWGWRDVVPVILAGATGSGLLAVGVYHIHKKLPYFTKAIEMAQSLFNAIWPKKPAA